MKVIVGVVQESPVFFDKNASLEKVKTLTEEYASKGCELLLFPESFIPGYPRGFSFGASVGSRTEEGRELFREYAAQSLVQGGEEQKFLEELAAKHNIYLVLGLTEKDRVSGSLYCSMWYISPVKGLLGVHRKIKPTGTERVIWQEADGESLSTYQTRLGKLGGLICWENYMPLARMSMYQKGVEIYLAPTADARDTWTATMQHIALEGRCFVLGCNQFFTRSMYPDKYAKLVEGEEEILCRGGSLVVSPFGKILAGPLYDGPGVLVVELDLDDVERSKLDFDVIGHYARPDIFEYNARKQPETVIEAGGKKKETRKKR